MNFDKNDEVDTDEETETANIESDDNNGLDTSPFGEKSAGAGKAAHSDKTDPLKNLKSEVEEQKKQNLYLRADFDNFRKQSIKERSELIKFGSEPIVKEFLNVYDNLERAASTELNSETMEKYKSGVDMIVSQFKKTLDRFGVEEFESLNQPFDPAMHEALTSEENPDAPANAVTQVFKKGFKLNGKVIRPAQVVVNTATASKKD